MRKSAEAAGRLRVLGVLRLFSHAMVFYYDRKVTVGKGGIEMIEDMQTFFDRITDFQILICR